MVSAALDLVTHDKARPAFPASWLEGYTDNTAAFREPAD
jgi:hypothetical protein